MKRVLLILPAFLSASCVQPIQPVTASTVTEHVFKRNYELGKARSAFVGESIVSVKDYRELHRSGQTMRATKDFRVTQGVAPWHTCSRGESFPVTGTFSRDGVTYRVVLIWSDSEYKIAALVDSAGRPYLKLLGAATTTPVLMVGQAHFEPPDVVFEPGAEDATIDSPAGFVNFELLYSGTDGKFFTLTYREYTPQDLLRPGFSQTLTYPATASIVRFRNVEVQVHEVTGERIAYTVTEDGLPAK